MEVRQLKYFSSVVECGSISRASVSTGISQPSLSQQIRNLEDEVGTLLLVRSSSGVEATDAGMKLYMQARRILRELDEAVAEVRLAEGEAAFGGSVSIGLPATIAPMLGRPLFQGLHSTHPALRMRITEAPSLHLQEHLANSRLDLALLFDLPDMSGLTGRPLFQESFYFVERAKTPTDGQPNRVTWQEVMNREVVLPSGQLGVRRILGEAGELPGDLQLLAEVDSLSILQDIVASGAAASFLPWSVLHGMDRSGLSIREVSDRPLQRVVWICMAVDPVKPALTDFIVTCLREIMVERLTQDGWQGIRMLEK